jgi:biopolymer transport protein ExbD
MIRLILSLLFSIQISLSQNPYDVIPEEFRPLIKSVLKFDNVNDIPDSLQFYIIFKNDSIFEVKNRSINSQNFQEKLYEFVKKFRNDATIIIDTYELTFPGLPNKHTSEVFQQIHEVYANLYNELSRIMFNVDLKYLTINQFKEIQYLLPIRIIDNVLADHEFDNPIDIDFNQLDKEPPKNEVTIHIKVLKNHITINDTINVNKIDFESQLNRHILITNKKIENILFHILTERDSSFQQFIYVFEVIKKIGGTKISIADPDAEQ